MHLQGDFHTIGHAGNCVAVGSIIYKKTISIRHFYGCQCRRVHRRIGVEQFVHVQDVAGDCVYLFVSQSLRCLEGHCPAYVVEERRGIGPIAAHRLQRLLSS